MRLPLERESRRIHLLTGVYLSGLAFAITAIALADAPRFGFALDPSISLAMIGLVAGIGFAPAARLERSWGPIVLVPFGSLATIASALYHVTNDPGINPGGCSVSSVQRGFPLPWSSTYHYLGSRCLLLQFPIYNPVRDMIFFSLDVIFYVAIGLAIIQLYRGMTGKTITARSSRINKMV